MAVADQILAEPKGFDMDTFGHRTSCGTVACLAGTAVLQAETQDKCVVKWAHNADEYPDGPYSVMDHLIVPDVTGQKVVQVNDFARTYLGLKSDSLFYRFGFNSEDAAKALLEAPYVS